MQPTESNNALVKITLSLDSETYTFYRKVYSLTELLSSMGGII